ncbi:hypothetical protein KAU32_11420 [bacterium]|nr:hypothetical protein [bacterium]
MYRQKIRDSMSALFNHIKTFDDPSGSLHSVTSTYWDAEFKSLPNIMNAFPMILGLIHILKKNSSAKPPEELFKWLDFILSSQNKDGSYNNAFGDILTTQSPPIIHIAADIALLKAYESFKDEKYIKAVLSSIKFMSRRMRRNGILSNRVVNQNAMLLFLLYKIIELSGSKAAICDFDLDEIEEFVMQMQHNNGGFFHGLHLSDQLSFYNAKTGVALLWTYELLRKDTLYSSIKKLLPFIQSLQESETGLYYAGYRCIETQSSRILRKAFSIRSTPKKFTKYYNKRDFVCLEDPRFIARSAIDMIFLHLYSALLSEPAALNIETIADFIDRYQLNNGSFPNAYGFELEWRNRIPVIRWEAYLFFLLSFFYEGDLTELSGEKGTVKIDNDFYSEDSENIFLKDDKRGISKWQR